MPHGARGRGFPAGCLLAVLLLGIAAPAAQAADLTMRLAEAEWQVIRQDVLPPFERACGCRVRPIDVPPEALTQGLKAMRAAGRAEYERIASEAAERVLWRGETPEQVLPPLASRLRALRESGR